MSDTKVRLVPIKTNAWANMVKYANCYDDLCPYFEQSGSIYTGLGDKEIKELKKYPQFENVDLLPTSTFWKTFKVRIPREGIMLDKRVPEDLLKFYFLNNHIEVKKGMSEVKAGAIYAMVDADEEARKFNTKADQKIKAIVAFEKLTPVQKRDVLRLYGENGDTISDEQIYERLFKNVEAKPEVFIDKWINNSSKEVEILLLKARSAGIIRTYHNNYYFGEKDSGKMIGRDLGEAIAYLEDPKNQEDRLAIMRQLKKESK